MNAVTTIKPHLSSIAAPDEMRNLPGWLVWRFEYHEGEDKPRKIPYYTAGNKRHGKQGSTQDLQQLTAFDAARTAAARRGFDGVGFVPLPEWNICALDFDHCVTNGELHPDLEAIVTGTYAEYSPSGTGVRAFVKGQYGNSKARGEPYGFEVFSSKGFVTFTGNRLDVVEILGNENTIAELDAPVRALCAKRFTRDLPETGVSAGEPLGLTPQQIDKCLSVIDADSGHDEWLAVGMALHHETQGEGFDLWNDWSELGSKYPGREVLLHRWSSFGKTHDRTVTARSLVRLANEHGAGINLNGPATADEFEDLVGDASPEAAPGRFAIVPAHEFATGANPTWVIKDVLPQAELVVMYGASGSGKSFLALDMAAAIARGVEWRGKRVRKGRVAYIAAEGGGGFRKRLKAYGQHNEIDLASLELGVIHAAPNMMEAKDAADVVKAIKAWGGADIVIVDTFAQVMPGANENAGEDVGKALTHCKRIHELTGAMIILIHHAGKDASKGARGWSGLRAAADAELEVVRESTGRALRLTKSKDGEDGMAWGFDLEIITVGVDEDLDPITSCVVIEAQMPVPGAGPARKLGPVEKAVNDVIQEFAVAQTEGIEVGPVLAEAVKRIEPPADGKRDTRKQRARRALEALCAGDDAPYWIADDGCITIC
jgi:KaiC/GvpD/RAD55 family RecA-like ATPase